MSDEIKVDISSRINSITSDTYVVVKVSKGENVLVRELSGWFLDSKIRKTVKSFKKTLEELDNE